MANFDYNDNIEVDYDEEEEEIVNMELNGEQIESLLNENLEKRRKLRAVDLEMEEDMNNLLRKRKVFDATSESSTSAQQSIRRMTQILPQEIRNQRPIDPRAEFEALLKRIKSLEKKIEIKDKDDGILSEEFWNSVSISDSSIVEIKAIKDSNFQVINVDGIVFKVNKSDNNITPWAENSVFAWRLLHPEVSTRLGDFGGLSLKIPAISLIVNDSLKSGSSTLVPDLGFYSWINLATFEESHLLRLDNNTYPVFNDLIEGKFSLDALFNKDGNLNSTSRLNIMSVVVPPYPSNADQVNADFLERVISSWKKLFQILIGSESSDDCEAKDLISSTQIFDKLIIKIQSSLLRLLSANLILHKLADVLSHWFSVVRKVFKKGKICYAFKSRVSAYLMLRDTLDQFDISPLDISVFNAQVEKGRQLQCFLGRSINDKTITSKNEVYSKAPTQTTTQICLGFICKQFLDDHTDTYRCALINGVCSRNHPKSKDEVKLVANDCIKLIEATRYISEKFKNDTISKLKVFVESE